MSNLTIFKEGGAVAKSALRQSALGKQIADNMGGFNRIATNTNGTFKRIVSGEQVGKPIRGEFNAIVVSMLAKPGRTYYATEYDPNAKPTLPDCWSHLGDTPDPKAPNRQSANCASCPKNIEGSGNNGRGKACRFQRKVALLLEGDQSGDLYQFQIPAKSLFGKGEGNTHPFESYCRFLVANGTAPDMVVTSIAYNLDAETMELNFTPARPITDAEFELVEAAQANPLSERLIKVTVGEADGATPKPAAVEEKPKPAAKAKPAPAKKPSFLDDDDDDEEQPEEPKVTTRAKKEEAPAAKRDLGKIIDAWNDEDGDEDE